MWNTVEWVRVFSSPLWCVQIALHTHTWQGNKDPVCPFKLGFFVIWWTTRYTMGEAIAPCGWCLLSFQLFSLNMDFKNCIFYNNSITCVYTGALSLYFFYCSQLNPLHEVLFLVSCSKRHHVSYADLQWSIFLWGFLLSTEHVHGPNLCMNNVSVFRGPTVEYKAELHIGIHDDL